MSRNYRTVIGGVATALAILAPGLSDGAGFTTAVQPYARTLTSEYVLKAILSAGDRVPLTRDPAREFRMIGVPDGLGAHDMGGDRIALFMNHELAGTAVSEPVVGAAAYRGAIISKFILNRNAEVLSGDLAYDQIWDTEKGVLLPPAQAGNTTPSFVRFCSGTLAWLDAGFPMPVYLAGEENAQPATFDTKGGLAIAVVDRTAYTLPHLGRFQHENLPVRPHPVPETVMVLMEDSQGPATDRYTSQLYLYVGRKDFSPNAHPLARCGLLGGKFYVFVPTTAGVVTEAEVQTGGIDGKWVEIENVASMTEPQLEAASRAVGSFRMIKAEDGAWSKHARDQFFFNTTGDGQNSVTAGNHLGRTYRLDLNSENPAGPCRLSVLYNADVELAAGFDIAITPDNLDVSKDYIMVCEDGTGFGQTKMGNLGRDGQIWRYDLKNNYAAEPVVRLQPPGRDGIAVLPGVWETSGIIDGEHLYGRNSWLFGVQAHPPSLAPAGSVEDGQLLLLLPAQ